MKHPAPTSILITGASSGLGAALAEAYAAPGIRLVLGGRAADRLETVAGRCRDKGATVDSALMDVTDREAMAAWVLAADAGRPLDLVIASAGISAGTGRRRGESDAQSRDIFATNLAGTLNTVQPLIPVFRARKAGQIALLSSLAGYRGFPGAPAYCASKAAVKAWGEALRGWLAADGVRVSVICPGFVRTPMTAVNRFPMPFLMEADTAARLIIRRLARNHGRIAFPWPMAFGAWLTAALPDAVIGRLAQRAPRKG